MRFSVLLLLLLIAACGTTRPEIERGLLSPDRLLVKPVKNLSGVNLKVKELYLGDAVGKASELRVDDIDVALLAEAAVFSRLDELGYRVFMEPAKDDCRYEVHGAITAFDMTEVRQTGRFSMAMTVIVVNVETQAEIARGEADREFQLMDMAPDEAGALGEQRFIEGRMQIFVESLAREAVDNAGF